TTSLLWTAHRETTQRLHFLRRGVGSSFPPSDSTSVSRTCRAAWRLRPVRGSLAEAQRKRRDSARLSRRHGATSVLPAGCELLSGGRGARGAGPVSALRDGRGQVLGDSLRHCFERADGRASPGVEEMKARREEEDDVVEVAVVPEARIAWIDRASVRERHQDEQHGPEHAGEDLHGAARYSSVVRLTTGSHRLARPSILPGFALRWGRDRA